MIRRVLVADDDPDLLAAVVASLRSVGATVTSATTGAELLERLAEDGPFDLLVTDISMPWMTGLQVAHSAREAGLSIPLLVMTGLSDPSIDGRVRALGGHTALLRKPFDLDDLVRAMRALVGGDAVARGV